MSLNKEIREEIQKAMLAKDPVRLTVARAMSAAFTNELVATSRKPQQDLPDDEARAVIKRLVKQRKDSIEMFKKGNRNDLVAEEQAELNVLETYLPKNLPKSEIKKVAEKKKAEMKMNDKAKAGILVGAIMKELKGQADGADVKEVVDGLFD
jgi:uncharacterized protein YqeY